MTRLRPNGTATPGRAGAPRATRATFIRPAAAMLALLVLPATAAAQAAGTAESTHTVALPDGIRWQDGPASLPPGARFAVLVGDPGQPGAFTIRVRVPAGYRIPPHYHSGTENITVISGTFHVGMGERFDADAVRPLTTGAYAAIPAGMRHFALTREETVIQLHGTGPWQVMYVDPADDPRTAQPEPEPDPHGR